MKPDNKNMAEWLVEDVIQSTLSYNEFVREARVRFGVSIHFTTIAKWKERGRIPPKWWPIIQAITGVELDDAYLLKLYQESWSDSFNAAQGAMQ